MRIRCVAAILIATLLAFAPQGIVAAGSATTDESGAADVVVLLDISQSVLPYFTDITDYVVSSVVKDYLRLGDTFHLLSFGDTTQVEIAEKVTDDASVKSFLGRLYLLYPLARHSDFAGALSYLYQYLADLPESRPKVVVVITDGVNNPPEGSPTYGMAPDQIAASVEATAAKIRANGWTVHFIKLPLLPPGTAVRTPLTGAQVSASEAKGGRSYIDEAAKALGGDVSTFSAADKAELASRSLSLPSVEFPPDLGKKDYALSFPLKITNKSAASLGLELDSVRLDDLDVLAKKSFVTLGAGKTGTMDVSIVLPDSLAQGHQQVDLSLWFANGVRVNPQHGMVALTLERNPLAALFRSGAKVALFIAIVVLGLFLIFLAVMLLRRIPRQGAEAPVLAAVRESAQGGTTAGAPATAVRRESVAASSAAVLGERSPASSDAAALLADSAATRRSQKTADQARTAGLFAEAARSPSGSRTPSSAQSQSTAGALPGSAALPSAAELAAARRAEAERASALLAEAAASRSPAAAIPREESSLALPAGAPESFAPSVVVKAGKLSVELRVEGQNSHIGTRNIHEIHAGSSKSVGGSRSDYLIFLMPMPRRIADLHFDGEKLTLVPIRPEFFPTGTAPFVDCLNKEIPIRSRGGYPLVLRFLPYERPADKMNRLLHCIEAPGVFTSGERR